VAAADDPGSIIIEHRNLCSLQDERQIIVLKELNINLDQEKERKTR
jgi:hypothetical protein